MNALARHDRPRAVGWMLPTYLLFILPPWEQGTIGEGRQYESQNIGNESQPNANLSALFTTTTSSMGMAMEMGMGMGIRMRKKKMCRYGQMKELWIRNFVGPRTTQNPQAELPSSAFGAELIRMPMPITNTPRAPAPVDSCWSTPGWRIKINAPHLYVLHDWRAVGTGTSNSIGCEVGYGLWLRPYAITAIYVNQSICCLATSSSLSLSSRTPQANIKCKTFSVLFYLHIKGTGTLDSGPQATSGY